MNVLALDTATARVSVAIAGVEGVLAALDLHSGRRHAETLTPGVQTVLEHAGLGVGDLDAVAVDVGPGGFTGLRIGLVTAKALAHVAGAPVCGVSSLDVVAHGLSGIGREVVVILDARKDELFVARYRGFERLTDPEVSSPTELADRLRTDGGEAVLVGDGALRHRAAFEGIAGVDFAAPELAWPRAAVLAEVVRARLERGDRDGFLDDIQYIRKPYYA